MSSRFVYVICQNGTEAACKTEIMGNHPELKFAFSRPGFITFKCDDDALPDKLHLKSTFARTYGWSVANLQSEDLNKQIENIKSQPQVSQAQHLHIWQRDVKVPGAGGFEPGQSVLAQQAGQQVATAITEQGKKPLPVNRTAKADELVFDIIMVEPDYWFLGFHYATSKMQQWPGGVPKIDLDKEVVSRAYFKLSEALLWAGIHINDGDICAEIGSSPGGACQLLLERGAKVLAIDPAEMEPEILEHENLTHLRCRGKEAKKKEFKEVRWLISDVNVAPNYTLDTIEEIVSNQFVTKVRGLVLTLKLSDLKLANEIPAWHQRVKDFGFQVVKTRQLAFNRREICLIAVRDRFAMRSSKRK